MTVNLSQPIAIGNRTEKSYVKDWMTAPVVVRLGQPLTEVAEFIAYQRCQGAIVVDEEHRVVGYLTSSSLLSLALTPGTLEQPLTELLVERVRPASVEDSILTIAPGVSQVVPVINGNDHLVGMITPRDLTHALTNLVQLRSHVAEALDAILESAYEGVVMVDKDGIVREINDAYRSFLGVKNDNDVIGKHVTSVIENTRLHVAIETGKPERGHIQEIQGQSMVVHRIPLWRGNEIVGAIGMLIFEGVSELYSILERANKNTYSSNKVTQRLTVEQKQGDRLTFESIIGESSELATCKSLARRAARTLATVMITGDSGTGKEMFAKAIHHMSSCANGPFISLNCAAIPEQLLESELFGYEDGAFTGASRGGKAGKFEQAHNGTLFLDEIGDMPLHMQAKILRVLQEREIERVGGSKKKSIAVRIIAATNQNLEDMVTEGTFREDLYYRLNIIRLRVPSLKERKKDIPVLLSHHLNRFCELYGFQEKGFTREAIQALMAYDWPGNVREVVNIAERLVTIVEEGTIRLADLPEVMVKQTDTSVMVPGLEVDFTLKDERSQQERQIIEKILVEVNGNKTKAAERLGIHRTTLYQKLKRYHL
ncbi:sigma 54-interacting transcriptional regulator [Bacillus fonticola]|uniref:sigma 54-interacting transcriptional regulator n=1 Tax=Bacillus fonticola TaxID=2728853 RepID=UPI001D137342|nr:sigma 54-interacting transcriptional regulator [Bacillus fonticola]